LKYLIKIVRKIYKIFSKILRFDKLKGFIIKKFIRKSWSIGKNFLSQLLVGCIFQHGLFHFMDKSIKTLDVKGIHFVT
jgi:hypothetical protein